ncbi:hypothetical protein [Alishewanella tabrizica]|uniref:Right handed beta helix domain-containing protein n=1 Tax=Alishewanella tabrizica TaxID=671278 RepID=A0ABQ2WLK3_9ALTE|nr:hypothetical protein [Alishewanella tabrizica]GGW62744.1 hypothetical protein GCM10008111_18390 [Alishewanella tabrizica]
MFNKLTALARRLLLFYLVLVAVAAHIGLYYLYSSQPAVVLSTIDNLMQTLPVAAANPLSEVAPDATAASQLSDEQISALVQQDIAANFNSWQALPAAQALTNIRLDGQSYPDLAQALTHIKDNSHLQLPAGIYTTAMAIRANNVTIEGVGHVILQRAAVAGKGMILAQGNNLTVRNIECRHISVPSKNGACVRLEGRGLTLEHVYFHNSQTGLLETAKEHGYIWIRHSRFENLAKDARAHSLYLNSHSLYLSDSVIIGNRHQHSLKSRGPLTVIERSIISSLSASGSRLIDLSNGGELLIQQSILQQGPHAVNNQAIGFGLEGLQHSTNTIKLIDNILLLERPSSNILLHSGNNQPLVLLENNLIIGAHDRYPGNHQFKYRANTALGSWPNLPRILCHLHLCQENSPNIQNMHLAPPLTNTHYY